MNEVENKENKVENMFKEVDNKVNKVDNKVNEVEKVVYHVVYTANVVDMVFYLSNEALTRCFERG